MNSYSKLLIMLALPATTCHAFLFIDFTESAKKSYCTYYGNIKKRWDKPNNEEQFVERKKVAREFGNLLCSQGHTDPYELERQISDDLWKKSWSDKNPIKRELLVAAGWAGIAVIYYNLTEAPQVVERLTPSLIVGSVPLALISFLNPMLYFNNLKLRQNKPKNEKDLLERTAIAQKYGDILKEQHHSNPYYLKEQIEKDGYQKTLGDRNPIKRDLVIAGTSAALITIAGLVIKDNYIAPRFNPSHGGNPPFFYIHSLH